MGDAAFVDQKKPSSSSSSSSSSIVGSRNKLTTHVIYDMDGTLLDTEKYYTIAQERILSRYGKHFDWSLKAKMMGKPALAAAMTLIQELDLNGIISPEEFLKEREEMLVHMFPNCEFLPGAKRLIQHLHMNNIPICVATSTHKHLFEMKTSRHSEIFGLMHHVVVGDDPEVKHGKPAPDIFLVAANRFEEDRVADTQHVLVFEDAPSGVAAAKNAGMQVIMVPDPELDKELQKDADQILESLVDFRPSKWGLPPFPEA